MSQWKTICLLTVLTWTATLFRVSYSDVYTSSRKISDMVLLEEQILNNLQTAVTDLGNQTASLLFSTFYKDRMSKIKERQIDAGLLGSLKHPNGIYHSIKQFATEYQNIQSMFEFIPSTSIQNNLNLVADQQDIRGARLSLLRLQEVYSLNVSDMVKGNYLKFLGPELSDIDSFEIGQAAFTAGQLDASMAWFQVALEMSRRRGPSVAFGNTDMKIPQTGRILALLGRVHVRQGNQEKASEMYRKAQSYDPEGAEVIELEREIKSRPEFFPAPVLDDNFTRLCTLQTKLTQSKFDRRLNCSYRDVVLPYYRFKQELVSVSPYIALFYDVISDFEGESIMNITRKDLRRGSIQNNVTVYPTERRTSDVAFLNDNDSALALGLSKRLAAVTDLHIKQYEAGTSYSSDPLQIVNYGLGGHYIVHHDAFDDKTRSASASAIGMKYGGNRLATFLLYLTDVERGGSTVFPTSDIAVSPVKNMGLFWYSHKPSGEMDMETMHGACPVVFGHKWVANKWVWLHGNTFTRRCGLSENSTQLDIDKYMRRKWV